MTEIVFETHGLSEDNVLGNATGWLPGALSPQGRELAREMGRRRAGGGFAAIVVSDLRRAVETVELAFEGVDIPVLHDWRLRECDYGKLNGHPHAEVHSAVVSAADRFPGGESWEEAVDRASRAIRDIVERWPNERVLVVGHMAVHRALERLAHGTSLQDLLDGEFAWQEGWTYELS